jgi:antitoxin StbD
MELKMDKIYAGLSASITEFKKNPTALLNQTDGEPIAILNHNKPAAYLVPAQAYEEMLARLENAELLEIAQQRLQEKGQAVSVDIDEL